MATLEDSRGWSPTWPSIGGGLPTEAQPVRRPVLLSPGTVATSALSSNSTPWGGLCRHRELRRGGGRRAVEQKPSSRPSRDQHTPLPWRLEERY